MRFLKSNLALSGVYAFLAVVISPSCFSSAFITPIRNEHVNQFHSKPRKNSVETPSSTSQLSTLNHILALLIASNDHEQVLLATVDQVGMKAGKKVELQATFDGKPTTVTTESTYYTGRFRVLQTLYGSSTLHQVEIDGTDPQLDTVGFSTSQKRNIANEVKASQCWILILNGKTVFSRPIETAIVSTLDNSFIISGPDDPCVIAYLNLLTAIRNPNRPATIVKAEGVLLDPRATLLERVTSFYELAIIGHKEPLVGASLARFPDAPAGLSNNVINWDNLIVQLLTSPALPRPLRFLAMQSIDINPLAIEKLTSEQALLLHYLITTVEQNQDQQIVAIAAGQLYQTFNVSSSPRAIHYFPEVLHALEDRASVDKRNHVELSGAVGTLVNLNLIGLRHPEELEGIYVAAASVPPLKSDAETMRVLSAAKSISR